ncbi:MAG: hypothetical protein DIU68_010490 [Chloroflexota bacterium]|nr:MAG: hypothetical protein DIU68_01940 [Chloroflexota bacterium]
MRVLILDANPDWASTLKLMLQLEGHDVHLADSDQLNLNAIAGLMPTVILLNCNLKSAALRLDTLRALKEDRNCRRFPVILLTTNPTLARQDLAHARLRGDFMLAMPFNFSELVDALKFVTNASLAKGRQQEIGHAGQT